MVSGTPNGATEGECGWLKGAICQVVGSRFRPVTDSANLPLSLGLALCGHDYAGNVSHDRSLRSLGACGVAVLIKVEPDLYRVVGGPIFAEEKDGLLVDGGVITDPFKFKGHPGDDRDRLSRLDRDTHPAVAWVECAPGLTGEGGKGIGGRAVLGDAAQRDFLEGG